MRYCGGCLSVCLYSPSCWRVCLYRPGCGTRRVQVQTVRSLCSEAVPTTCYLIKELWVAGCSQLNILHKSTWTPTVICNTCSLLNNGMRFVYTGTQQWAADLQRATKNSCSVSFLFPYCTALGCRLRLLWRRFLNTRTTTEHVSVLAGTACRWLCSTGSAWPATGTTCPSTSCTASSRERAASTPWAHSPGPSGPASTRVWRVWLCAQTHANPTMHPHKCLQWQVFTAMAVRHIPNLTILSPQNWQVHLLKHL